MTRRRALVAALAAAGAAAAAAGIGATRSVPSLEGTYILVKRELPDGSVQRAPDVIGMLTYTKEYRNFNVYWKNQSGQPVSISYIARYELSDDSYQEKSLYYRMSEGATTELDVSGKTGTSPVMRRGNRMELTLPLYNEPRVVFEADRFTATRRGEFVDYWEQVK